MNTLIFAMESMFFENDYTTKDALKPTPESKGFEEFPVPTDGNCLFAALAMSFL